ncbi:MAG TPA: hypothetical protein VE869_05275 [Gemmatimonas sp.]|nr:hypothetical protein [Gemmatimonas sp.]
MMGRRPNRQQRANARRVADRASATAVPPHLDYAPRVPLVGFESLYEITRNGQLYSVRAKRFIKRAYKDGAYLKVQVEGRSHVLNIQDAVADSWAQASGCLFHVAIPATTVVVLARDANEAREVAPSAHRRAR